MVAAKAVYEERRRPAFSPARRNIFMKANKIVIRNRNAVNFLGSCGRRPVTEWNRSRNGLRMCAAQEWMRYEFWK